MLLSKKKNKIIKEKQLLIKKYLYWFGRDRMYDKLYFVESKWDEKNSFMKIWSNYRQNRFIKKD